MTYCIFRDVQFWTPYVDYVMNLPLNIGINVYNVLFFLLFNYSISWFFNDLLPGISLRFVLSSFLYTTFIFNYVIFCFYHHVFYCLCLSLLLFIFDTCLLLVFTQSSMFLSSLSSWYYQPMMSSFVRSEILRFYTV